MAHLRPGSLETFLRSTALPLRDTVPTASSATHPYDTISIAVSEEHVPFVAIKFDRMASSMVHDLFNRVVPEYPVVDQGAITRAEGFVQVYASIIAQVPIDHEPSVSRGTHFILDTCITCLHAIGEYFDLRPKESNVRANV